MSSRITLKLFDMKNKEQIIQQKLKFGIAAALVADAATLGLHWVYNQNEIKQLIASDRNNSVSPLFHTPLANKFYTHRNGQLSVYGEELLPMFDSLLEDQADHVLSNKDILFKRYYDYFSAYPSRLNKMTKHFVQSVRDDNKSYADSVMVDAQANGFIKIPFLYGRYYNHALPQHTKMNEIVDFYVSSIQLGNETLVASQLASKIYYQLLHNDPNRTLKNLVIGMEKNTMTTTNAERILLKNALELSNKGSNNNTQVTDDAIFLKSCFKVGLSCALPHSFVVALAISMKYEYDLISALSANCIVGGDNCSRSMLIAGFVALREVDHGMTTNKNTKKLDAKINQLLLKCDDTIHSYIHRFNTFIDHNYKNVDSGSRTVSHL